MKIGYFVPTTREIAEFKRCFYLAKLAASKGHDVTIICVSPTYSYTIRKELREKVKLIQLPYLLSSELLPLKSVESSSKASVRNQEYLGQLLRGSMSPFVSIAKNFDVVHAFTIAFPMTALPAIATVFTRRQRLVIDWVDSWSRTGWGQYHNSLIQLGLTLFEEKISPLADAMTVTSDFLAERAISLGVSPNKIFKIPSGANVDLIYPIEKEIARQKLGYQNDVNIVVYEGGSGGSGAMPDAFNHLIDAFALASLRVPHSLLVIVGCDPDSESLKRIKKLGITGLVEFIPKQPYTKLSYYLAIADLLVLPLEETEIFRAGLPGRFGDYLCSGRPILASRVGDVANIIEREKIGLTALPNNVDDFSEKMVQLLTDVSLREILGTKVRKLAVEKYSWEKMANKVMNIYRGNIQSDYDQNGRFRG